MTIKGLKHSTLTLLFLWTTLAQTEQADLRIKVSCISSPFHLWENGSGQLEGPMHDILTEVTQLTGLQFDIDIVPMARLHANGKQGHSHLLCPIFLKEERRRWLDYFDKTHIFVSKYVIWSLETDPTAYTNNVEHLLGKRIGIERGRSLDKQLLAYAAAGKLEILEVSEPEALVKMLENGRLDVILSNLNIFESLLQQWGKRDQFKHGKTFFSKKCYFSFSRASTLPNRQHIYKKIEQALSTLEESGFLERLEGKYRKFYYTTE